MNLPSTIAFPGSDAQRRAEYAAMEAQRVKAYRVISPQGLSRSSFEELLLVEEEEDENHDDDLNA
jgi:hypothetical protein